jgi:hypothetical protein
MIIDTIKKEISEFRDDNIKIVNGFEFNQPATIEQIIFYYNSKYESGDFDDQGDRKYFYNITRVPCNIGTKAIDFDTKHIKIQTAGGGSPLRTWFFERDLKFWMKDQKFGQTLNRIFHELPIFGSVVLKIIDNKIHFVDLRNFFVEQSADTLDQANYIIESHNYTPIEFRKIAKKKGWKNINKTLKEFYQMRGVSHIRVYERYGEVKDGNDYTYKRVIVADVGKDIEDQATGEILPRKGTLLNEEKVEHHPYREFHWEKIPGRWLGVGRVEMLIDPQIRINEISNQQVKSSYWSTLRLWQTKDEGVNRNLLTDVDNGEILNVEQDISQIDMADRNLAYYYQEIQKWLSNRDELTFSQDPMRGETGPSGTTLGAMQIAQAQASSYFEQIRENVAMAIKDMLYEVIIPGFKKQNNTEHILRIAGEDLDHLNNLIIEKKAKDRFMNFVFDNNKIPSKGEYEILKTLTKERVERDKEKLIKIPGGFYDNLKYKIDIVITGEALDTQAKASNLFAILQALTTDPTLLSDPTKKKFLNQIMEQAGLNPTDFETDSKPMGIEQLAQQAAPKGAGGGVSRPAVPNMPTQGETQQTL